MAPNLESDIKQHLQTYHDLLRKWQKTVNLVAPSTLDDAWSRHFEDSLQMVDLIPPEAKVLADIGSGAGFPGLVIGLARPDLEVHLIESDSRKGVFLLTVSRETGASNVHIHTDRIESKLPSLRVDVVTARALAPLTQLLALSRSQWDRESPATLLFMKGAEWQKEVDSAKSDYMFHVNQNPSKTDTSAAILCITNVRA
jgi:16S rRNA (guanine527-N7)-methyltransferase